MVVQTLVDLLGEARKARDSEALRYFNGYREWAVSYEELLQKIGGFASCLDSAGLTRGDRLVIWGENRIGWVIAFWGAVARGIEVVPLDFGFSPDLAHRICEIASPKLIVHSPSFDPSAFKQKAISLLSVETLAGAELEFLPANPEDVVETVFTSGTTGKPRGVVIRHRNLCANLRPFQSGIEQHRRYLALMQPLRILNLLPLSHLFGQTLGLFIPLLMRSTTLFVRDRSPEQLMKFIHSRRVSVMVAVPLIAEQLERFVVRRFSPKTERFRFHRSLGIAERWWRNRRFHKAFGWKFWALVLGGAPVPVSLERFWRDLGIATIQGYGLTEASPIVAVNHPLRSRVGSLGKVLEGQQIRISEEGEILVKGPGVVREYVSQESLGSVTDKDGWLHTGDLGEMDSDGNLSFKGRIADRIVMPDGMNVYPEELEAELEAVSGVRECAVIGKMAGDRILIHAVIVPEQEGTALAALVQQANRRLEQHQRIRSWSLWPDARLPRTPSTLKLQRNRVRDRVLADSLDGSVGAALGRTGIPGAVETVLGTNRAGMPESARLAEDLGLTSLDRVDLHAAIEDAGGTSISESKVSELETVGDLRKLITQHCQSDAEPPARPESKEDIGETLSFPRWTRSLPVRAVRSGARRFLALPLFNHYLEFSVTGTHQLEEVRPPVIFVANHTSHLDVLAILSGLPTQWRWRIAPAMRLERFSEFLLEAHSVLGRVRAGLQYYLACGLFNAFPLPQEVAVLRRSMRYAGELAEKGYCPLLFPEGRRSEDGTLGSFKSGIGLMVQKLELQVVPLYIDGLFGILPAGRWWPRSGRVQITIGSPMEFTGSAGYTEVSTEIETAVRELSQRVLSRESSSELDDQK